MDNHIFVAREKCGCIVAAEFDSGKNDPDIIDWIRRGDLVTYEERDTIAIERCAEHQRLWEANHAKR